MPEELARWGHAQLTQARQQYLSVPRTEIAAGRMPDISPDGISQSAVATLAARLDATLIPVFNLTSTVLHTNLMRASLPDEVINNNAAAVLLVLNTLALKRKVPVSRARR